MFTVNCNEKTKIKKKRAGVAHFFKKEGERVAPNHIKIAAVEK